MSLHEDSLASFIRHNERSANDVVFKRIKNNKTISLTEILINILDFLRHIMCKIVHWVKCCTFGIITKTRPCNIQGIFGAKIRKIGIHLHTPVLLYKSGVQGCLPYTDIIS